MATGRPEVIRTAVLLLIILMPSWHASFAAPQLPPLNQTDTGLHLPGKFVWFDLATTRLAEQQAFYGDVFGWRFRRIGSQNDDYSLVLNNGQIIAGMFSQRSTPDDGSGAVWIGFMSVEDVTGAIELAERAGAALHAPLMTLPHRGRLALLRDLEGALFGIISSDSGDPPDDGKAIGEFLWMDVFARTPETTALFYQQLVGYEIARSQVRQGVDRIVLKAGGLPRAGVAQLPEDANRAGWLPYVRVEDVAGTLARVEAAGGYVLVAPQEDLLDGNLAVFVDPQGGILGIVKWPDSGSAAE